LRAELPHAFDGLGALEKPVGAREARCITQVFRAAQANNRDVEHEVATQMRDGRERVECGVVEIEQEEAVLQDLLEPTERIERDSDRDNFMEAQAAVDYGIVDTVLSKRPDIAPRA